MGKIGPGNATEQRRIETEAASEDRFWALKDVSFDIQPGEIVGIIGPNGSGKSTLLKILSRITEPTAGEAEIKGRVGSLLEVGSGFHPELTGRENIFLNGTILGMKKAEVTRKFDKIVAFSETEEFIDTPVKRYSSGMYVRLAFAVAAHLDPEILLVDEVLAVGDAGFQRKCIGKMSEIAGQGRTVLFVSHNMGAVRQLTRRCVVLDHGMVSYSGDSDSAVDHYLSRFVKENTGGTVQITEDMREGLKKEVRRRVEIVQIAMEDAGGAAKGAFVEREDVVLNLMIRSTIKTDCVEIVFQIKTVEDVVVSTVSSGRIEMEVTPGAYSVKCRLINPSLARGRYKLLVYLLSGNRIPEDCIMNALVFEVMIGETAHMPAREVAVAHGDVLILQREWDALTRL
jgi:lipopolysaccharide transport system ATP-binding protein